MHLFINGLAASAGGGLTYLRNVIAHIALRSDVRATVLVSREFRPELSSGSNISFADAPALSGTLVRGLYEQLWLRDSISQSGADVLLSTGNFALYHPPIPQIILSRNGLYLSDAFRKDLWSRGEYALLLDTWIKGKFAKVSVNWADRTVAPTQVFARELHEHTGKDILAVHHGFDRDLFCNGTARLPQNAIRAIGPFSKTLRLLCVSHYNYYRNFETLFKALAHVNQRSPENPFALVLTCKLDGGKDGAYQTKAAAKMLEDLDICANVVQLGPIPYQCLHELYEACDIYVTAAYAETFAHPLVEAMSSGLPIVASDLAVHREICSEAACFFPCFSEEDLANCLVHLAESRELRLQLGARGRDRSKDFSWQCHVNQLLAIATQLMMEKNLATCG